MRSLVFAFLLGPCTLLRAGDAAPATQDTAVVTGIVCQSCKTTVVEAMKKLPGVREVEFAKGDKEGSHKLTFASASATLTKNDAEHALGEHVKEFGVVSLDKTK